MKSSLFKKILYATDMSENAKVAAEFALSIAHEYDATLTIVNVVPDLVEEMSEGMGYDLASHFGKDKLASFYTEGLAESKQAVIQRIQTVCDEAGSRLTECRIKPDVDIRVGHPVEQIVQAAVEGDCDLIILGAKGHSMLDEILVGSVARGVVKKSRVPVLTIPM